MTMGQKPTNPRIAVDYYLVNRIKIVNTKITLSSDQKFKYIFKCPELEKPANVAEYKCDGFGCEAICEEGFVGSGTNFMNFMLPVLYKLRPTKGEMSLERKKRLLLEATGKPLQNVWRPAIFRSFDLFGLLH